jgi:hypothetical protein
MADAGSCSAGTVAARLRSGWEMSLRAPGTEAFAVVGVVEAVGGERLHEST